MDSAEKYTCLSLCSGYGGLELGLLRMTDGIAACKIELLYSKKAKPKVCREFPKEPCWGHTKENKGKRICLQQAG